MRHVWRRRVALIAVLAAAALATGQPFHDGRPETGGGVNGVVALINSSSPADDIYAGQFCGGVVVDERVVLTAAHCVATRSMGSVDVVVGADNLCRDQPIQGLRLRVSETQIHPAYDAESARFDLALLTLAANVPRDYIRSLATTSPGEGHAVALGWGGGSAGGIPPCRLTHIQLRLLPEATCAEQAGASDRGFHPVSMLCAIPDQVASRDTCPGDSGGPLVLGADPRHGDVVGIISWGRGCGNEIPGVYARAESWLSMSPPLGGDFGSGVTALP